MLIDGCCCLGAAIAVFSVELQGAYAMVAMYALKDAAVLDAGIGVMSHGFYSSLISGNPRHTMVTCPAAKPFSLHRTEKASTDSAD